MNQKGVSLCNCHQQPAVIPSVVFHRMAILSTEYNYVQNKISYNYSQTTPLNQAITDSFNTHHQISSMWCIGGWKVCWRMIEMVPIHLIYLFQDFYCPNKIDISPEISSSCIQRIPSQQWTIIYIIYILNKFWCVPSNILRNIEWNTGAHNPSRIANIPLLMYISTVVLGTIFLCYLRQDNPVRMHIWHTYMEQINVHQQFLGAIMLKRVEFICAMGW